MKTIRMTMVALSALLLIIATMGCGKEDETTKAAPTPAADARPDPTRAAGAVKGPAAGAAGAPGAAEPSSEGQIK
jgi:hypothetical protein